jgi:hypothetical protein
MTKWTLIILTCSTLAAILTGQIEQRLTKDPRGTRYVVTGKATDETTVVCVVVRFVEHDQLLVLTVYEKK